MRERLLRDLIRVFALLVIVVGNVSGVPAFNTPVPHKIPNTNILLEITLDWPPISIPNRVFYPMMRDAIAAIQAKARHFGGMHLQMPSDFLDAYEGFEITIERNEEQPPYQKDLPTFQDANNIIVGIHEFAPMFMLRTFSFECWRVDQRDHKERKFAMGIIRGVHWAWIPSPAASATVQTSLAVL
ncbi:MAG: hypothetical protein Q9167_001318 [Letrouitia subvulpina]